MGELGSRMARIRLEMNLTQAQLAQQAGVSKRTVERLESGGVATQLSGLIRVCRVLVLIERFEMLIPEPLPSPVAQLKLKGRTRKRASAPRIANPLPEKWKWADAHGADAHGADAHGDDANGADANGADAHGDDEQ
jgi:transcriptional regulator with XRE-family HTH domain